MSDRPRAWNSTLPIPSKPMERGPGPERKTPLRRCNPERKKRERLRAYGPEERRKWVKALGCIICGRRPCDNAHVRTGGMGRKADAEWIVPLCRQHHREHHAGPETFQSRYVVRLAFEAGKIERAWQEHLAREDG